MDNKNFNWRPVSEYTGGRVLATNGLDVIIGEINSEGDCESEENGSTILCGITGFIKIEEMLPELKESEDKKIKSVILKALMTDEAINILVECGIYYEDVESWLKKQGEKIDAIENFDTEFEKQVSYLIASAINKEHEYNQGYVKWTANALLNYAKHELEKQGEQKPTEWSKEDEKMWKDVLSIVEGSVHPLFYDKVVNWLKSLKYRVLPQPKQEWSEEDSMMIDNILGTYETLEAMLDLTTSQDRDILENMKFERGWIKRLKNRVQLKQGWNEDDELTLQDITHAIDISLYETKEKEHLKCFVYEKFRPQSQWKPSDEQIEVLDKITNNHNLPVTQTQYNKLINLQDDLKKLREE